MKKNFLSLAWFLDKLNLQVKKKKGEEKKKEVKEQGKELYKGIKLINSSLTVVLHDGSVLSKPNATEEHFNECVAATTIQEIINIMTDKVNMSYEKKIELEEEEIVTEAEVGTIVRGYETLKGLKDFTFDDGSVYWGDIRRSMPQQLVKALCVLVENDGHPLVQRGLDLHEGYLSLKKFWLKCCLNPNAQSAEDLYTFLSYHKFKIDRHGNFYAYRRVKSKHTNSVDKVLMEFVSNAYTKVKAIWKYNPKHFTVHLTDQAYTIKDTRKKSYTPNDLIGNLADLYLNLSSMEGQQYTSAHTGKEDYRIGEVISMPRHEGDDNNNVSCSTGFHAASKKYDYSGFGDVPILMIINPMDVLSVPKGEVGKLRTCRWFFACVLAEKEKFILDEDKFDVTNLGDLFEEKILANLEADIEVGIAEEVQRHKFYVPTITGEEIKQIVKTLDDMKAVINSRIKKI